MFCAGCSGRLDCSVYAAFVGGWMVGSGAQVCVVVGFVKLVFVCLTE